CRARFRTRGNESSAAVLGESARWGDAKREPPRTRNGDWVTEMNRVYGHYFAQRPGIVLGQLRAKGWYPAVAAPSFNQFGGNVPRFPTDHERAGGNDLLYAGRYRPASAGRRRLAGRADLQRSPP